MSTALKTIHDQLLAMKPDDASHDAASCGLCSGTEVASASTPEGGDAVSEKTYTEAEFNAVTTQVAELEARITEMAAAAKDSELDSKVAEATAEFETKVSELQAALDAAVLEAETAKTTHAELVALLEETDAAQKAADELEGRKAERVAAVKEVASFPESYLEANADRFAAMSDEAFEAALEDWKAIAAKAPAKAEGASTDDVVPSKTAMTASRSETDVSPLREVLGLRFAGIDARTV